MLIATALDTNTNIDRTLDRAHRLRDMGFTRLWSSQIFGPDTLTVLAVVGREIPDLDLGTAVVPIHPRHPSMLAAQARTVQDAIGARLSLGIGLSHRVTVEGMWGLSYSRPVDYMSEYLDALVPMLRGEKVTTNGQRVKATTFAALGPKSVVTPDLLIAALGTKMLGLAGSRTNGTLLWLVGHRTISSHIAPTIRAAADQAGRSEPRIVCSLPIAVTDDVAGARARINESLALYATLPSYAAMLEKEGATTPADVGLVGTHDQVLEQLGELELAGVTEFSGSPAGNENERDAALAVLLDFRASS